MTERVRPPPTTSLTVATFNIHGGVGTDGAHDLSRIADIVAGTGASIVAVQEVNRRYAVPAANAGRRWRPGANHGPGAGPGAGTGTGTRMVDQVAELADRLGMGWAFGPNVRFAADHREHPGREYGVAVLTSWPVRDTTHLWLPRFPGSEQRGVIDVRVEVDGRPVRVVCSHLQHTDRLERVAQARALTSHLASTAEGSDEPTVLMGDFNTRPGTPEYRVLTRNLADAWIQVGRGRGRTMGRLPWGPRIDYVLLGGPVRATAARVWRTRTSDHDLVAADLLLAHA